MKVDENFVVTMEYKIETDKGELIESSLGKGAPIEFKVGDGLMLPGVEKRILGLEEGAEEEFEIPPAEAFGEADGGPVKEMSKTEFPKDTVFKAGEKYTARLPEDQGNVIFEILENRPWLGGKYVSLDFIAERARRLHPVAAWLLSPLRLFQNAAIYVNVFDEMIVVTQPR